MDQDRPPPPLKRLSTRMIAARDTLLRHGREKHRAEQELHPQTVRPHSKFSLLLIVGLMAIGVIAAISLLQFAIEALGGGVP